MTIGTLLRPAAPSGPVPTNVSFLDDRRIKTADVGPTETHRFILDRNSTVFVRAAAIVQRSDGDDKYASVARQALARLTQNGSLVFHQQTLELWDPTTAFAGVEILFAIDSTLGAPDRMLVKVKGLAAPIAPLHWQVAVTVSQLDQSIP